LQDVVAQNPELTEKLNLSAKLVRLIEQLKTTLTVLLNILKVLHNVPQPQACSILISAEKPNETSIRITQLLQEGQHIKNEVVEKKIYVFGRVAEKFKQVGESYRNGSATSKVFIDVLVLYERVINELSTATKIKYALL